MTYFPSRGRPYNPMKNSCKCLFIYVTHTKIMDMDKTLDICATKAFFDSRARIWDDITTYDCPPSYFNTLIRNAGVEEGSKVVDLGCGTGVLTPHLSKKVGNRGIIYAVDISDKMLEILKVKYPLPNIRPLAVPAENMRAIPDKSIDSVICFCAFPHFENKRKALSEIYRVLRPGGNFVIAHLSSREELNQFHSKLGEPVFCHDLPEYDEMRSLLSACNLEVRSHVDTSGRYELAAKKNSEAV